LILAARTDLPAKTLKELVAYAKAHPGMTYSSPGQGSTPHLSGELLARESKLDLVHVPYKGGGQAVLDVIAGRIDFYAGTPSEVVPHIKAGKLTPIAVLAAERSRLLPDLPTSIEQGFPYLKVQSWTSVAAPAGIPMEIAEKISADLAKVIKEPSLRDPLLERGAVFVGSTPKDLAAFYEEEHSRFGPIVKSLGLKP
jgi:tripartite-type tricarboxylate transporter receptor subunit TctC